MLKHDKQTRTKKKKEYPRESRDPCATSTATTPLRRVKDWKEPCTVAITSARAATNRAPQQQHLPLPPPTFKKKKRKRKKRSILYCTPAQQQKKTHGCTVHAGPACERLPGQSHVALEESAMCSKFFLILSVTSFLFLFFSFFSVRPRFNEERHAYGSRCHLCVARDVPYYGRR